jgi:putative phosphonate catabolism associated alcohol dehydrogenase
LILGHEIIGEIVELGKGRSMDSRNEPLAIGDRITWTLIDSCGKCYYCRDKNLPMKCIQLKKYGHDCCSKAPHFLGGFAEYCFISPGTCVIKIPENVSDEEAAPANCALATVVAGWDAIALRPFENVLIQGAGALGVYATALASHYGCSRIIVTDIVQNRLDFIKAFGATDVLNTQGMSDKEIIDTIRSMTKGFGVDAAMEVAGVPGIIPIGLKCLRIGGRYMHHGNVFPGADFNYDMSDIIFRLLTIKGGHNYDTQHLQAGIDFLSQTKGKFPFERIVNRRVTLDNIQEGLSLAGSGESIRVAVIP